MGDQYTTKKLWDVIKASHVGAARVQEVCLRTLMSDFNTLKMMEFESINEYSGKLSEIASKAATLEETIEEPKLVNNFLITLPRSKFIHIVASLEQVLNLNATGFEDVVGRVKAYEERVKDDDTREISQLKLLFTKNDQQNRKTQDNNKGRWKGTTGK